MFGFARGSILMAGVAFVLPAAVPGFAQGTKKTAAVAHPAPVANAAPVANDAAGSVASPMATDPAAAAPVAAAPVADASVICDTTAAAKPKKHGGFGHFLGKMVKDHGVQALEIATPVGAAMAMSKATTGMAAAQGAQAVAMQQQAAMMGKSNATALAGSSLLAAGQGALMPGGMNPAAMAAVRGGQAAAQAAAVASATHGANAPNTAQATPPAPTTTCQVKNGK